jgi:hypothetical protein
MFLYAGKRPAGGGQVGCFTTQKSCHAQAIIRTLVRATTVFYLEVYGPGANAVYYTLQLHAKVQPLRCVTTCTLR